ncbi:MAG: peptidoglycan-binding domain-containing protein [Gaiellaceae bacterium]
MARRDDDRDGFAEDWFEDEEPAPEGFHDPEGETWLEPTDEYDEGPRDRRQLVAGLAAAVVLLLIVVGLVRVFGGGDETASTLPATTAATEPAGTGTTDTPVEPSVTLPEDVTLAEGDESEDVALLQEALVALGYDAGEPDGLFGAATADAVQQFQADSGLTADGIAGPETLAAINEALASGA